LKEKPLIFIVAKSAIELLIRFLGENMVKIICLTIVVVLLTYYVAFLYKGKDE